MHLQAARTTLVKVWLTVAPIRGVKIWLTVAPTRGVKFWLTVAPIRGVGVWLTTNFINTDSSWSRRYRTVNYTSVTTRR